jgi:hypothetical protein
LLWFTYVEPSANARVASATLFIAVWTFRLFLALPLTGIDPPLLTKADPPKFALVTFG